MPGDREKRAASFGAGAAAYARSRPSYPPEAVAWLVPPAARRVLDLGAGTGKLTAALVARGLDVVAVDPSEPMLAVLRRLCPAVSTESGAAEDIPLPRADVDAVVVAQAWHWVDPTRASPEIARVLRPGGTLGLVWNTRDATVPWMERFQRAIGDAPSYDGEPVVLAPFGEVEAVSFRWRQPFTLAECLDLAASRSAYLVLSAPQQAAMLEDVRAVFAQTAVERGADRVLVMPYVTRCFRYVRR